MEHIDTFRAERVQEVAQVRWEDVDDLDLLRDALATLDDVAQRLVDRIKQVEAQLAHPCTLPPVRRLKVVR
jgi:hypothetical protein